MKTLITKFLALGCLAVTVLASCKKDEIKTVAGNGSASVLSASTTTPVLTKATLTSTAITLTGTAQSYGYQAAVTYSFQLAVKGTNFAAPTDVALPVGTLTKSYTVQDFNNILLSMNLPVNKSAQLEVRLKTALSSTAGITYSNVLTVTATPFPLTAYIYVPGAYQGWDPPTADSLQSATGNGVYTGIINFTAGNLAFKITPAKKWDVAYGTTGSGTIGTSGSDISVPSAGQYYFVVNLNTNTIAYAPADYFSLIGSSTPGTAWSTDTDMKFNNGTLAWEKTTAMITGEFKVRMNHDWGNSYGIPKSGSDGFGVANTLNNSSNDNIQISAAGNYKVTFTVGYSTDLTKIGKYDSGVKTAAYTSVKQ